MDIAILREKFHAASRFVAFYEEAADWVDFRVGLAAETQDQADALALAGQVVQIMDRGAFPGPTTELILADLQGVIRRRPDLAATAEAVASAMEIALDAIRVLGQGFDAASPNWQFLLTLMILQYRQVLVMQLRKNAELGKVLRDSLEQQLDEAGTARWSSLTDAEQRLVRKLGTRHLTGEELAGELDLGYTGTFKTRLSTLVRLKILANDKTGYYVVAQFRDG